MRRAVAASASVLMIIGCALVPASIARASGSPPAALQFTNSYLTADPGSSVSLSWPKPAPGEYFLLASNAPNSLPNFDSSTGMTWPAGSDARYISADHLWSTTSTTLKVNMPQSATQGAQYDLELFTCDLSTDECSNSPGGTGPTDSEATLTVGPPEALQFRDSNLTVAAGTSIRLHWPALSSDQGSNEYFLLVSTGADAVPNFGTSAGINWPSGSDANYISTWKWWQTTSDAVSVTIPADAAAGTTYDLQLYTCTITVSECSNDSNETGPTDSEASLSVATGWTGVPYRQDFSPAQAISEDQGAPLDATFDGAGNIWNTSEFSNGISEVPSGKSVADPFSDTANVNDRPFADCSKSTPTCPPTDISALSERVITSNGLIWFTQGGWEFGQVPGVTNESRVVAVDPTTDTMCTYDVPGNDNQVIGLASTGTGAQTEIWFAESIGTGKVPSLDSFLPSQVGDGCPGGESGTNESYTLTSYTTVTLTTSPLGSPSTTLQQCPSQTAPCNLQRFTWQLADGNKSFPTMIAVDPTSDALWVTNLLGSEVDRVDLGTYQITPYQLKEGSKPWQITVDANYVYAIDYGARNLVRIDKNEVMGPIDYVPLPRTSDSEQAYGLAMSADGTTLYFTLSDDGAPSSLGGTTFGYVNVAAWEAASALCPSGTDCAPAPADAVVYTGLDGAIDPNGKGDFRGIAVNGAGDVAIADADPGSANGVIRLTP